MPDGPPAPEIAYYFPEPYWLASEGGWIKSLLLFFDQVAILLPDYMYGRHAAADPTLAEPLEDRGLLLILQPESFVDEMTTARLTEIISTLVDEGAFDDLPDMGPLAQLSMSRMGYGAVARMAQDVYAELERRGLASGSEDGVSIPMHPAVRGVYLAVLAQLAREAGARQGLDLHPTTNGRGAIRAFRGFMDLAPMPSRGNVVAFDTQQVSIDLDDIPLDEVLDFRAQNVEAHRRYMRNLRQFALELSLVEAPDRQRALEDRRSELEEQARDLKGRALSAWKSPKDVAGFGLGLAGAAWSLAIGNPVPAALGGLGAVLKMLPSAASGSAYSYLFKARRDLR